MRQLVKFFLIILLLLLSTEVRAGVCRKPAPFARFTEHIRPVEYIRTESAQDLTQWQMGHSVTPNKVLGVGGGTLGTRLKVRYEMRELKTGLVCVVPVEVVAEFYAAPQIHVASNFARGSCEYSEVMFHEQKHIDVLRKFHREYKGSYKSYFQKTLKGLSEVEAVPLEEAESQKKQITAHIMTELNAYTQNMMGVLNQRQKAIDTKGEYKRVIAKCKNWDKKLGKNKE